MKGIVEERAAMLGEYIIESKATVRSTAKKFGVSKSTVHKDVSQRLKVLNPALYRQVREILDTNKSERHIRGGLATKKKYLQKKHPKAKKLKINCNTAHTPYKTAFSEYILGILELYFL